MKALVQILVLIGLSLSSKAETQNSFEWQATINSCSGGLVIWKGLAPTSKAYILTNGHCLNLRSTLGRENSYMRPGENFYDLQIPYFLNATVIALRSELGVFYLTPRRLVFATMTGTDVALFEVEESYQELKEKNNISPVMISSIEGKKDDSITVVSGYYNRRYDCSFGDRPHLVEGPFYTIRTIELAGCTLYPGMSGSIILSKSSGHVIGLANTSNSGEGKACSLSNPCLYDAATKTTRELPVHASFGVSLMPLMDCFDQKIQDFNFSSPQCKVGKPPALEDLKD